ncbi:MAG TPA: PAS domain S-box protein, partial [Coleofasciculaceae cyanobacterium]
MNRPLHVLLIEDSEDDAELLIYELDRNGYSLIHERVETASAMQAALEKKPWDIIIADYNLPNFSAPAALDVLQKTGVDLPFIIVSGKIGEETAIEAMKAGAHDYLMKGKLARLAPAIERELRDAEERRQRRIAEQTIRQNEERFRLLIENALDIITLLSNDGIIRYASPSVERVLGYQPRSLVDKNILDYIHPEDADFFLNRLNQIIQTPHTRSSIEFKFQHQDGSWRIIEAIGQSFLNPSEQQSIVINSRDITERKQAEEIRSALERERQLSEERFQFVSMMSHEFRNPLSTILASIQLLKTYGDNTPKDKKEKCMAR